VQCACCSLVRPRCAAGPGAHWFVLAVHLLLKCFLSECSVHNGVMAYWCCLPITKIPPNDIHNTVHTFVRILILCILFNPDYVPRLLYYLSIQHFECCFSQNTAMLSIRLGPVGKTKSVLGLILHLCTALKTIQIVDISWTSFQIVFLHT